MLRRRSKFFTHTLIYGYVLELSVVYFGGLVLAQYVNSITFPQFVLVSRSTRV